MEPYRETVRSSLRELRELGRQQTRQIVRGAVLFLLAAAAVAALIMYLHSAWGVPWQRPLLGIASIPLLLGYLVAVVALMPLHVDVRRDWVQITRGSSAVRIKPANILGAELIVQPEGADRFHLRYLSRRGAPRTFECVLARSVDREELNRLIAHLLDEAKRQLPVQDTRGWK